MMNTARRQCSATPFKRKRGALCCAKIASNPVHKPAVLHRPTALYEPAALYKPTVRTVLTAPPMHYRVVIRDEDRQIMQELSFASVACVVHHLCREAEEALATEICEFRTKVKAHVAKVAQEKGWCEELRKKAEKWYFNQQKPKIRCLGDAIRWFYEAYKTTPEVTREPQTTIHLPE